MKRCPGSLAIREMKIKTMMRYCCMPIRMTKKLKKKKEITDNTNTSDEKKLECLGILIGMHNDTGILQNTLSVLYKVKYTLIL